MIIFSISILSITIVINKTASAQTPLTNFTAFTDKHATTLIEYGEYHYLLGDYKQSLIYF
jgi:hypothetical protein